MQRVLDDEVYREIMAQHIARIQTSIHEAITTLSPAVYSQAPASVHQTRFGTGIFCSDFIEISQQAPKAPQLMVTKAVFTRGMAGAWLFLSKTVQVAG